MRRMCLMLVFLLIQGLTVPAFCDVPQTMMYQGKLTNDAGVAYNGNFDLTFRIYTDPTGGTMLWDEAHPGVIIEKGLFALILGDTSPLDLPFDTQYWLEIQVNTDITAPRMRFTTNPYAFRAAIADSCAGTGGAGDDWGAQVVEHNASLTGEGTVAIPLKIATDGVETNHILDGVVTPEKINISGGTDDQILKIVSGTLQWASDVGGGAGDDWGAQVVEHNPTLDGEGTAIAPLIIAQQGASDGEVLK